MPFEVMDNKVVILANGDFPSHPLPIERLKSADTIICCDGAANSLIKNGMEPNIIIGDLDSLNLKIKERFTERVIHIAEQETNDLTKAFEHSLRLHPSEIIILGATGKREDHTLGNISLLSLFAEKTETPIEMITDYGTFTPAFKTTLFKSKKGRRVSIFSLDCDIEMESEGLEYPLNGVRFDSWWKATLNIASEDNFTIRFSRGRVIVFISHE